MLSMVCWIHLVAGVNLCTVPLESTYATQYLELGKGAGLSEPVLYHENDTNFTELGSTVCYTAEMVRISYELATTQDFIEHVLENKSYVVKATNEICNRFSISEDNEKHMIYYAWLKQNSVYEKLKEVASSHDVDWLRLYAATADRYFYLNGGL